MKLYNWEIRYTYEANGWVTFAENPEAAKEKVKAYIRKEYGKTAGGLIRKLEAKRPRKAFIIFEELDVLETSSSVG